MVPWAFLSQWCELSCHCVVWISNGVGLFLAPLIPLAIFLFIQKFSVLQERNWKLETGNWGRWLSPSFKFPISSFLTIRHPLCQIHWRPHWRCRGHRAPLVLWKKTRWPTLAIGLASLLVLALFTHE